MSEFKPAMAVLIRHEVRAYGTPKQVSWSDIHGDFGGETNWGWSLLNIQRMGLKPADVGAKDWSPGCLKAMPESVAWDLYEKKYWEPAPWKNIVAQDVATKLFDFSVNANPHAANDLAQRSLVALGVPVLVDGVLGPKTLAALNAADPVRLLAALAVAQRAYYQSLIDAGHVKAMAAKAAGDPDWSRFEQVKFQAGWFARAAWVGSPPWI